jgi:hypothetical protein
VSIIELAQYCCGGARVFGGRLISGRVNEMWSARRPEPIDQVREPPGDRGDRLSRALCILRFGGQADTPANRLLDRSGEFGERKGDS